MKVVVLLILGLAITGCDKVRSNYDQCLRQKLFTECLSKIPKGPESVHYNDWSEVVEACSSSASAYSVRTIDQIPMECRP